MERRVEDRIKRSANAQFIRAELAAARELQRVWNTLYSQSRST